MLPAPSVPKMYEVSSNEITTRQQDQNGQDDQDQVKIDDNKE